MPYSEFCTLLRGVGPDTPLGRIVQIRAEDDKDVLKRFTKEQRSIRNAWRNRHNMLPEMTEDQKKAAAEEAQRVIAGMFGRGR